MSHGLLFLFEGLIQDVLRSCLLLIPTSFPLRLEVLHLFSVPPFPEPPPLFRNLRFSPPFFFFEN